MQRKARCLLTLVAAEPCLQEPAGKTLYTNKNKVNNDVIQLAYTSCFAVSEVFERIHCIQLTKTHVVVYPFTVLYKFIGYRG